MSSDDRYWMGMGRRVRHRYALQRRGHIATCVLCGVKRRRVSSGWEYAPPVLVAAGGRQVWTSANPPCAKRKEGMTDEQLAELERLADAAESGPWDASDEGEDPDSADWYVDNLLSKTQVCVMANGGDEETALFIAASRTAVPQLISALREARALLAEAVPSVVFDESRSRSRGNHLDADNARDLYVRVRAYLGKEGLDEQR